MKIALMTLGTRGDVQPYAVLGRALKERGHEVVLSSAKNFESLSKSYGVDFVPVDVDFQQLLESDDAKKMMKNPFLAKKHLNKWVYPMMYNGLKTFYNIARESDRVLYHVKTLADNFADQFPEKMIRANVIPALEPTSEFINPVFSALPIPKALNRFSYNLTRLGLAMWKKPINQFRSEMGLPAKYKIPPLRSIYGVSSHFLEEPSDYPGHSKFTGFWTDNSGDELPQDLLDFINSGTPPLLITFGSMPFNSNLNLPAVLKKLNEETGSRLLIVKGWGLNDLSDLEGSKEIKVISGAPYDKLLPHVKAAVHHGGIGTIAACLEAGKPFLACPVLYPMGDQHFWGTVAYKKGVGLKPAPLSKMTESSLINAVKKLLSDEQLYINSKNLMERLKSENGLDNAIQYIESTNHIPFQ